VQVQQSREFEGLIEIESSRTKPLPPSKNPIKTFRKPTKYIEYGASSGWGNQLICLEHALNLAYALNRTLILPPMMKHYATLLWIYRVEAVDTVYSRQIPNNPMTTILDFEWTTGIVPVVDWKTINEMEPALSQFIVTDIFSPRNTIWTLNREDVGKEYQHIMMEGRGGKRPNNCTSIFRNAKAEMIPYDKYDVLTFNEVFHDVQFDPSFSDYIQLNVTYSVPIRRAVQNIVDRLSEDGATYGAVHLRGTPQNFTEVFRITLDSLGDQIEAYHQKQQSNVISMTVAKNSLYTVLVFQGEIDVTNRDDWVKAYAHFQ